MSAPWYDRGGVQLFVGHCLDVLRSLPSSSAQCVVTSPPYFGLRAYGTEPQVWGGAGNGCEHEWGDYQRAFRANEIPGPSTNVPKNGAFRDVGKTAGRACATCGSWKGELGSEPTPALFVAHLVEIFAEVRRVLRPDGLCFVNIGDSYAGSGKGPTGHNGIGDQEQRQGFTDQFTGGRPKSLLLVPERLAIALSDDGWIVRSRIAWCKRAPMPESVRDRPTSAWEHIWMLSKSGRYYWDAEAVMEPYTLSSWTAQREMAGELARGKEGLRSGPKGAARAIGAADGQQSGRTAFKNGGYTQDGRNMRNFWLTRAPKLRLRSDLTDRQRADVLERLAAHMRRGLP